MVKIINYTPETKIYIKNLNVEWLEKYFYVEPIDFQVLDNPQTEIIDKGGMIFYAAYNDQIVGTTSLMKIDETSYELTKMAVTAAFQGLGISKALMEHCILVAKQMGAQKLILYSNTKLEIAIKLYRKYNFVEVPLAHSNYKRSNIKMELYTGNALLYETENKVEESFEINALPPEQQAAQIAEFRELKKVIINLAMQKNAPISILDIGVGNGRIVKWLHAEPEIWQHIASYDGTDNSQSCVNLAQKTVADLGIEDRVFIYFSDAAQLDKWQKTHDLIITTWFTGGNFMPPNFPFDTYKPQKERLNLDKNPEFTRIWQAAYNLLNTGGALVFGCVYLDNDATRLKQEAFYQNYKMTVITDENDTFTATKQRFWSQRFTQQKFYDYLDFADISQFFFTHLDNYAFAMQVRIMKI